MPGDLTGDGHPDLVVPYDDKLWLYAAGPHRPPAREGTVEIGSRWLDAMTLTAPGDADGDGRPDLLARDAGDGQLRLYRGGPDGGFDGRTEYGHGYGTPNRPLLAGAADADGNGVAGLWATTDSGTGTLMFSARRDQRVGHPRGRDPHNGRAQRPARHCAHLVRGDHMISIPLLRST